MPKYGPSYGRDAETKTEYYPVDNFNFAAVLSSLQRCEGLSARLLMADHDLLALAHWAYSQSMEAAEREDPKVIAIRWDLVKKAYNESLWEKANPKMPAEDLKGMQGVPEVYLNLSWSAITADQVENVAKFAADLGVPFNLNMQDPIYGEDDTLTHDND